MYSPEDFPVILGAPNDRHAEATDLGEVKGAASVLVEKASPGRCVRVRVEVAPVEHTPAQACVRLDDPHRVRYIERDIAAAQHLVSRHDRLECDVEPCRIELALMMPVNLDRIGVGLWSQQRLEKHTLF